MAAPEREARGGPGGAEAYERAWVEAAEGRAREARQQSSVRPLGGRGRRDWDGWSVRAATDPWHVGRYRVHVAMAPREGDPLALTCSCPWGMIGDRRGTGWCRHRAAVGLWLERKRLVAWRPNGAVWRWNIGVPVNGDPDRVPEDPFDGLAD